MTNKVAVICAAIFHYCIRFSIFISPNSPECIGGAPGLIVLIGACFFLIDLELFPKQYESNHIPTFRIIETILALLAIEFWMICVWSRLENSLVMLIKLVLKRGELYQEMGGDNFTMLILSGIAICFTIYAINTSNSNEKFARFFVGIFDQISGYYEKLKAMRAKPQTPQQKGDGPTLYTCIPVQQPVPPPQPRTVRNPCCPIHGDSEINRRRRN